MLGQNHVAQPNWHVLTFLHAILICKVIMYSRWWCSCSYYSDLNEEGGYKNLKKLLGGCIVYESAMGEHSIQCCWKTNLTNYYARNVAKYAHPIHQPTMFFGSFPFLFRELEPRQGGKDTCFGSIMSSNPEMGWAQFWYPHQINSTFELSTIYWLIEFSYTLRFCH